MCVNSVCYFIHQNDKELGPIQLERGLCQGDSISPYLFIIRAKGLSICLQDLRVQRFDPWIVRGAATISQLFFADNSYLFFKANPHESLQIKQPIGLRKCLRSANKFPEISSIIQP